MREEIAAYENGRLEALRQALREANKRTKIDNGAERISYVLTRLVEEQEETIAELNY